MTSDKARKLILIFRQMRELMKHWIDNIGELGEAALMIFVESEEMSRKSLLPKVAIEKRLLNKKQLAHQLGVSARTISNLQTDGLPVVKLGKRILFDYEEVLTWAKGKEIKGHRKNKLRVVK